MVVIAVMPEPVVSPKNNLAKEEHSPALYIKTKLQCNEEKPLNDIPIRKSTTCSDVVLFLINSLYKTIVRLTFNVLVDKILM